MFLTVRELYRMQTKDLSNALDENQSVMLESGGLVQMFGVSHMDDIDVDGISLTAFKMTSKEMLARLDEGDKLIITSFVTGGKVALKSWAITKLADMTVSGSSIKAKDLDPDMELYAKIDHITGTYLVAGAKKL